MMSNNVWGLFPIYLFFAHYLAQQSEGMEWLYIVILLLFALQFVLSTIDYIKFGREELPADVRKSLEYKLVGLNVLAILLIVIDNLFLTPPTLLIGGIEVIISVICILILRSSNIYPIIRKNKRVYLENES